MYQDKTLVPAFYEKCSVVSNAEARQLHSLKTWAVEFLKSQNTCTIILDGLDECHHHTGESEAKKILEWLLLFVIPDCEREGAIVRLLILGQKDGDLDDFLSGYPSIRLDTEVSHSNDVRSFVQARASEMPRVISKYFGGNSLRDQVPPWREYSRRQHVFGQQLRSLH
jgi:hypothetical protein